MSDCISRQAAIDVADAVWSVTGDKNVAKVWDQIKDLPSAQPERWIPCSERLPEEEGRYLITGKRGTVYSLEYEDKRWYGGIEPIAWMPLPSPYKGGEKE